ncbi:hypothetical protein EPN15_04985 [Patescibacteria group bacterium]|nr:MAG: hypothetical protein EPN15_04985 [Patescibacteria group bacterium]
MNKKFLSKLMQLDSKRADEYLVHFADEVGANVMSEETDNDHILESLNLLEEFVYRTPEKTIEIVKYLIDHPKDAKPELTPMGEFHGRGHKDIVIKCTELLSHLRYIYPNGVLPLLACLTLSTDKDIKCKALEVLKKFAQYDYNVLMKSKIGYDAQRKALDFILAWSRNEQLRHIDFVETVLKELLSSSIQGTTSGLNKEDQYTLTIHFGAVSPTDFLKKMRREAIDLVYELYLSAEDPKLKLKLVKILDEATQSPSNIAYGDDVAHMIADDLKYLASIYRKIIFGEEGKMTGHLGIVATVEERLYWINRREEKRIEESEQLRLDILNNELYHLFRLLVGDTASYQEQEGWDNAEKKRTDEMNDIIKSINESNIHQWIDRLNRIATQRASVEDWKLGPFRNFFRILSQDRPEMAQILLNHAIKGDSDIKYFIGNFLEGFRRGMHFEPYDTYTNWIAESKDINFVPALICSLDLRDGEDLEKYIRDKDLELLELIVEKKGSFAFLQEKDVPQTHYALINALARNYARDPKKIELLINKEIITNPRHLSVYFNQFPLIFYRKLINIQQLQPKTIKLLKEKIIELSDLDWEAQELISKIGKREGLKSVINLILKRIHKAEKEVKKHDLSRRYEPVPYHFNPGLRDFITNNPEYEKIGIELVEKMTTKWNIYNWHISNLLEKIGKGFDDIIKHLISKGDDDSLAKAALTIQSINGVNFDLCIEIVRRTNNKKIINQVESNMYATGVVSGEYGIANAYKRKAEVLEKYKLDKDERVKQFAGYMIENFHESEKKERQKTDEDRQIRKTEFEE